jgi:hypothetical protein
MMKVACGQLRPTGSTCQVGLAIKSRAVSAQIDETADDENIADERELLTKGRGLGAEALFRLVEGMSDGDGGLGCGGLGDGASHVPT